MQSHEKELLKYVNNRTYLSQGFQNELQESKLLETLLIHKKLPLIGWNERMIEKLLLHISSMDSNNFHQNAGVGEREGRVFSGMVARRHFYMSHGIGRSGDIGEIQPKAAGSSLIYKVAIVLLRHALEICGLHSTENILLLPMATGMTLTMCLLTMKNSNPDKKYVIWSRIDQKSCFKSILTAGLIPLIVDTILEDGSLVTNVSEIRQLLVTHAFEVLCVMTTTSCFAPRQPDQVDQVAKLCTEFMVGHIINNAYGLQCKSIMKLVNRAAVVGRVDAVVQSTDKNFMVPVGGAIVMSPSQEFIQSLSKSYPGRASAAPIVDLFITLLSMGETQLRDLLMQREVNFQKLKSSLHPIVEEYNLNYISSPQNCISIAVALNSLILQKTTSKPPIDDASSAAAAIVMEEKLSNDMISDTIITTESSTPPQIINPSITFLGSMLFQRNVSGARVVKIDGKQTSIGGYNFVNWCSHTSSAKEAYLTIACAIGMTENDIDQFISRLRKILSKFASGI